MGYYTDSAFGTILCGVRWLSRDPIGYYGGDNLYAYYLGDPVGLADPDGLDVWVYIFYGKKGNYSGQLPFRLFGTHSMIVLSTRYGLISASYAGKLEIDTKGINPCDPGSFYEGGNNDVVNGWRIHTTPFQDFEMIKALMGMTKLSPADFVKFLRGKLKNYGNGQYMEPIPGYHYFAAPFMPGQMNCTTFVWHILHQIGVQGTGEAPYSLDTWLRLDEEGPLFIATPVRMVEGCK